MNPLWIHEEPTLDSNKCVKCSDIKKYLSHTVYPHKTGGYIQPVSSEQSDHLKKLEAKRGICKTAKGIFADNSWDRWLRTVSKQYMRANDQRKNSQKNFVKSSLI